MQFCSGATTVAPITYELLKESLAPTKERKDSYEDKELDEELFQPFERDHEAEVHEAEIETEEMPGITSHIWIHVIWWGGVSCSFIGTCKITLQIRKVLQLVYLVKFTC